MNHIDIQVDIEKVTSTSGTQLQWAAKVTLTPTTGQGFYIQTNGKGNSYAAALSWSSPTSGGYSASFVAATPTGNYDYSTNTGITEYLGTKYNTADSRTSGAFDSSYTSWSFDTSKKTAATYYSGSSREVDFKLYGTTGYYDYPSSAL